MKFEVDRQAFLEALGRVAGGVSKRYTLPVLKCVNIMAGEGEVKLATTNLEIVLRTSLVVNVAANGGINLPHKLLTDVVARMNGQHVGLELNEKTDEVTIASGGDIVVLKGEDNEHFYNYKAPFSLTEQTEQVEVTGEWLKRRIQAVAFSAADDDTRPALQCVRWVLNGNHQTIVAVDGFRLTRWGEILEQPLTSRPRVLHLPSEPILKILAVIEDMDVVTVTFNCEKVAFETSRIWAAMNLADINFPEYEPVIPNSFKHIFLPDLQKLAQACELVLLLTEDKHHPAVRLEHVGGNIEISTHSSDGDGRAVCSGVELESDHAAVPGFFGVNGRYMIAALANLPLPNLKLKMNDPTAPIALTAADSSREWLHLIMPMHIGR